MEERRDRVLGLLLQQLVVRVLGRGRLGDVHADIPALELGDLRLRVVHQLRLAIAHHAEADDDVADRRLRDELEAVRTLLRRLDAVKFTSVAFTARALSDDSRIHAVTAEKA